MAHAGPNLDDATLVRAVQEGDPEAFEVLFRRHYGTVRRVCARRMAGVGDADEVAQESFVRAYERIDHCTGDRRFGAWVQVIAFRLCADSWRQQARTTVMEDPVGGLSADGPDNCEEALLGRERSEEVRRALAALPERQRQVIIARDVEGRRPREIAAALALSVGAVDSLLMRARRRMLLACRATGVEQGAVSAAVTTTGSLAMTSMATGGRALTRLAESVSGMLNGAAYNVAAALGIGHAGPTVVQRVAGLATAGALLVAPLVSGPGGPGPALPVVPPVELPALVHPGGLAQRAATAVPQVPPAPAPPGVPAAVGPQDLPAAEVPGLPAMPAGSAPALPGGVAVSVADAAAATLAEPAGAAEALVSAAEALLDATLGLAGSVPGEAPGAGADGGALEDDLPAPVAP